MPKYLDMHGLETLTGDIENTYLKKNQRGAAGGVASLDSNGKVPTSQIPGGAGGVQDVSYKGTSLVDQTGTANIPPAQTSVPGLAMVGAGYGLKAADPDGNSAGRISTDAATSSHIRFFTDQYRPITPYYVPEAVFRGLAKVAGDDTQTDSQNPVGTYTDDAKEAIQEMLNVPDATENADEHSALLTEITQTTDALQKDKAPVIIDHADGNPIVLTDGADGLPIEGMKIHFLPKQNLNGQDAPYPPGGGKNLVNIAPVKVTSQTTVGGAFSLKAGTYSFSVTAKNNTSIPGAMKITVNGSQVGSSAGIPASATNRIKIQNITLDSDSSNVGIVINASTAGYDIDISEVQVETGSSSTDFAPYSNICPISGWQGLAAWRTGKNLVNQADGKKNARNWWIGSVAESGEPDGTFVLNAGTYTLSVSDTQNGIYIRVNGVNIATVYNNTKITFTLTEKASVRLLLYKAGITVEYWDTINIQLEAGSTASPYTPYVGQSYPVTFPDGQTIYGGTLDAVNGVLSVEWCGLSARYGDIPVTDVSEGMENKRINTIFPLMSAGTVGSNKAISNIARYAWTAHNDSTPHFFTGFSPSDNVYRVYLYMPVGTSEDLEMLFVCPLATPYEIPLSDIPVPVTLIGDNTIWSDANGTIELDYRADTKLFIAKNKQDIRATIAPIEDGTTASKAYSAGMFFYHDGNFCKAKTSIASGATFTLNTNYQITTVSDELFALN